MTRKRGIVIAAGLIAAGMAAEFAAKTLADGIPSSNPLYYSGTLTENGVLVNDSNHTIGINLYADATSTSTICQTTMNNVPISNGRFRIPLSATCKAMINANPAAQIEVLDGAVSLGGRSPIGAVPYAVEADHATTATTANAAGGTLATTLASLQGQVHPASAFSASLTTAPVIPSGTTHTQLDFDSVVFDTASEYNATTSTFTPKNAGTYLITCTVQYNPTVATGKVAIFVHNGTTSIGASDYAAAPTQVTPSLVLIASLKANDSIACFTDQTTGADQTVSVAYSYFSAARIY